MGNKIEFLRITFDMLNCDQVKSWLSARVSSNRFQYVITPNVDHIVRLQNASAEIRSAYDGASICLCDSRVLHHLARLIGVRLTVVPGSDLVARLFEQILKRKDRVCLIGGEHGHVTKLSERYPGIEVLQHIPPMGLLNNQGARQAVIAFARGANARFILLAVGSPQQELIAWEMAQSPNVTGTALCIGASVDFLVGSEVRAPKWVQRASLEWAWRLCMNPHRMAKRYLIECPKVIPLIWRWRRAMGRVPGGGVGRFR